MLATSTALRIAVFIDEWPLHTLYVLNSIYGTKRDFYDDFSSCFFSNLAEVTIKILQKFKSLIKFQIDRKGRSIHILTLILGF